MSGECDKCGEHCLDCKCGIGCDTPGTKVKVTRMNVEVIPLEDCMDPPAEILKTNWVNVKGRKEHEELIQNAAKCKELGLDQVYETIVYLSRWGGWLNDDTPA